FIRGEDEKEGKYIRIENSDGYPKLEIKPKLVAQVKLLQALMHYYVFNSPALVTQQYGHRRVINELFKTLYDATKPKSKHVNILPQPFRDDWKQIKDEPTKRAR